MAQSPRKASYVRHFQFQDLDVQSRTMVPIVFRAIGTIVLHFNPKIELKRNTRLHILAEYRDQSIAVQIEN